MGPTVLFRSRATAALGIAMPVAAALAELLTALDSPRALLSYGAPIALFGVLGWAAFWRPSVEVSDGGITVVNTWRTQQVPWPAVEDVDGRYGLRLRTAYGVVRAWGAPAPAGRHRARQDQSPAAMAVRERLASLRGAGHLEDVRLEAARLPQRWHTGLIIGTAVLVGLGLVLPHVG